MLVVVWLETVNDLLDHRTFYLVEHQDVSQPLLDAICSDNTKCEVVDCGTYIYR